MLLAFLIILACPTKLSLCPLSNLKSDVTSIPSVNAVNAAVCALISSILNPSETPNEYSPLVPAGCPAASVLIVTYLDLLIAFATGVESVFNTLT